MAKLNYFKSEPDSGDLFLSGTVSKYPGAQKDIDRIQRAFKESIEYGIGGIFIQKPNQDILKFLIFRQQQWQPQQNDYF